MQNPPVLQHPSAPQEQSQLSRQSEISSNGTAVNESGLDGAAFGQEDRLPVQAGLVKGLSDTPWLSQEDEQARARESQFSNNRQESFGASSFGNEESFAPQPGQQPQGRAFEQQSQGRAAEQQPLQATRALAEPVAAPDAVRASAFSAQSETPFVNNASTSQQQQPQMPETAFAASAGRAFSVEPQGTSPAPAAPVPTTAYQVNFCFLTL